MTTFIKAQLKKSNAQTNIDKLRVAANITESHIISKLIFLTITIPTFMMLRQLFQVKDVCKNVKKTKHVKFNIDVWTFWSQLSSYYASSVYLTVSGSIIPSKKWIG